MKCRLTDPDSWSAERALAAHEYEELMRTHPGQLVVYAEGRRLAIYATAEDLQHAKRSGEIPQSVFSVVLEPPPRRRRVGGAPISDRDAKGSQRPVEECFFAHRVQFLTRYPNCYIAITSDGTVIAADQNYNRVRSVVMAHVDDPARTPDDIYIAHVDAEAPLPDAEERAARACEEMKRWGWLLPEEHREEGVDGWRLIINLASPPPLMPRS